MDDFTQADDELTLGFNTGFSRQQRQDISDWLLYAQNQADAQVDRSQSSQDWSTWMAVHEDALAHTGGFQINRVLDSRKHVTSLGEEFIFDFQIYGGLEDEYLQRLGDSVMQIADLPRMIGLTSDFLHGRSEVKFGRYKHAVIDQDARGQTVIMVYAVQLHTESKPGSFLLGTPKRRRAIISTGGATYEFDTEVFAEHREQIRHDLTRAIKARVRYLELKR